MKKIYSFLSLFIIALLGFSQSIGIYNKSGVSIIDDTITINHQLDTVNPLPYIEEKDFADVVNESSGTMEIKVARHEVQIIQGTSDYLCWGATCFAAQNAGTNPVWFPDDKSVVNAGDTAGKAFGTYPLQVYFVPNNNVGTVVYRYEFYDANNPSNSSSVYIKYNIEYLPAFGLFDQFGNSLIDETLTFWVPLDTVNPLPYYEYKDFVSIVNQSGTSKTIKVARHEESIIQGTSDYLCWGATCFAAQTAGSNPVWLPNDELVVQSGDTAGKAPGTYNLQIYFVANNKVGEAVYRYEFYDANNAQESSSIKIKHSITYLSSNHEIKNQGFEFSLFPNPASTHSFVKLDGNLEGYDLEILVHNILGQEQDRITVQNYQERIKLNHEDLKPGVYFVSVVNNGEYIDSKRLVVR